MKYLSDYTEKPVSDLMDKYGAFFAFGNDQFNAKKKEGIQYANCGAGLICDVKHAKKLLLGLTEIRKEAIKQDLAENGKEKIILRELLNHEAFYTGEIEYTTDSLTSYDVTEEEIWAVYNKNREKYEE